MSKSCCFAVVLAVICLSVILLSLEADAQPTSATATTDATTPCGSSKLEEVANMIEEIALKQEENAREIRDLKRLLVSVSGHHANDTSSAEDDKEESVTPGPTSVTPLPTTVTMVQTDVTMEPTSVTVEASQPTNATEQPNNPLDDDAVKPSKEALVAALVCKYLVCL